MQIHNTRLDGGCAILVSRTADEQPDSTEIKRLATAAGYDVVATLTQRREEDAGTWLGRGKAQEVANQAATSNADAVIIDGGLSPGQYANLIELLPAGITLMDRYRLVLDIFAKGAGDRRAVLQVEAATLKYELPRLRQTTDESLLNRATEKGSPVLDAERRIDKIEAKLAELAENVCEQRQTRRRAGYGLIAIAGYTNAGKTTLLQRLADDLSVTEQEDSHQDLHTTAPIEDHLFVTLETISRRGDVGGLPVIYTDTVGFIDALPHGLVESFSATPDEVATADVALLVIDATDAPERIREKVRVSLAALDERPSNPLGVLNKIDAVDETSERRAALHEFVSEVVTVSALEGTGIDRLKEQLYDGLPSDNATFCVRNDSGAQAFISWAHNLGVVETHYKGDVVRIELEARSNIIERARSRVEDLSD